MRHLYTRILLYVIGLDLLIVAVLIGLFVAVRWDRGSHVARHVVRLARYLASEVGGAEGRSLASRDRRLAALARALDLRATLYDANGEVVAVWGETLPRPKPGDVGDAGLKHLGKGQGRGFVGTVRYSRGGTLSVASRAPLESRHLEGLAILVGVGLLLSLLLVPLARYITRPLRELEAAARGIAAGDLERRAEVKTRDEIGSLALAFNHMAEQVATSIRQEKELVAGVSHELRAPLSRIRIAAELLADQQDLPTASSDKVRAIAEEVHDLDALIEHLLTRARLESAAFPMEREVCDLSEILRRVVAESKAAPGAESSAERIDLSVTAEAVTVRGNRLLLARAVHNLLANALQYSAPETRVRVALAQQDGRAVLAVEDQGIGIPASEIPRIFDPFFRGERSRSRRTGGVGIGLSLARQIIERHDGEITVESEVGRGTRVVVGLPVVNEPSASTQPRA